MTHETEDVPAVTRIIRVSRIFGGSPVAVLAHTEDGRRAKISVPNWEHINPDTGGLTESGWKFVEDELFRIFGKYEWAEPSGTQND